MTGSNTPDLIMDEGKASNENEEQESPEIIGSRRKVSKDGANSNQE